MIRVKTDFLVVGFNEIRVVLVCNQRVEGAWRVQGVQTDVYLVLIGNVMQSIQAEFDTCLRVVFGKICQIKHKVVVC